MAEWWKGAGNDMLGGLLGQSQGDATTGYGTFAPKPQNEYGKPPPPIEDDDVPDDKPAPATGGVKIDPNKGYKDMLQKQLLSAQNNLMMVRQQWANAPGMKADIAISAAQHAVMTIQSKLSQAGLKSQQGGY